MKKVFYSAATVLMLGNASLAADLVTSGAAAPLARAMDSESFDWSGFYVGVHGGLLTSNGAVELDSVGGELLEFDIDNEVLPSDFSEVGGSGMFGAQLGYNAQWGNFVLGAEGDISFSRLEASGEYVGNSSDYTGGYVLFNGQDSITSFSTSIDGLATLRVRAGVAADRALFYVTGGLAAGQVDNSFSIDVPGLGPAFSFGPWSEDGMLWGYTAGLGVEYAVTDQVTAKLEYLHYDLADRSIRGSDPVIDGAFGPQFVEYNFLNNGNLIRGGINFKF